MSSATGKPSGFGGNWRNPSKLQSSMHYLTRNYSAFLPSELLLEISKLSDLLVRDFVLGWFKPMSTYPDMDCSFPNQITECLSEALGSLCLQGYKRANICRLLCVSLVKVLEKNVYWYKLMKAEVRKRDPSLFEFEPGSGGSKRKAEATSAVPGEIERGKYVPPAEWSARSRAQEQIALEFRKHKRLHCACTSPAKEQRYQRFLATNLVSRLFADDKYGQIFMTLCSEIVAGCVLNPVFNLFTPETVNYWISECCSFVATSSYLFSHNPPPLSHFF